MKTHVKLCIPEKVLSQHAVVLGKTGKGKSSVLRHIVEHLLREKKRVCVVDPKGDWWGLKSSADGKGPGFPVIMFGDFKEPKASDVPINAHSGKEVAELVATGNRPCVIGFRGWTHGAMIQFWLDFAQALFNRNAGELYLIGDEFHNFAPKGKIFDVKAGECLHWSNRILSEGRGIGLVCLIASQRPQKVHNDTLTSCETLIALGVTHASDRAAVKDWIDGCGDKEKGAAVLNALAGLGRGEAFVWSPEIKFGPERVKFPMFETFDSFAPPQLQPKVSEKGWAGIDLEEVKSRLAGVIEEARANDPKELRREIAELRRQLTAKNAKSAEMKPAEIQIKEVPVMTDAQVLMMADLAEGLQAIEASNAKVIQTGHEFFRELNALCGKVDSARRPGPVKVPAVRMQPARRSHISPPSPRTLAAAATGGPVDGAQQKILDTVLMLRLRGLAPNREMIARWMDIHPNGGRYGSNLAWLRSEGYLDGFELTEKGNAAAAAMDTGLNAAREVLEGSQQDIFDLLSGANNNDGPQEFDRESLAQALGIHPNGGRYGSNLARLRTMGLIPERGTIKLTEAAYQ